MRGNEVRLTAGFSNTPAYGIQIMQSVGNANVTVRDNIVFDSTAPGTGATLYTNLVASAEAKLIAGNFSPTGKKLEGIGPDEAVPKRYTNISSSSDVTLSADDRSHQLEDWVHLNLGGIGAGRNVTIPNPAGYAGRRFILTISKNGGPVNLIAAGAVGNYAPIFDDGSGVWCSTTSPYTLSNFLPRTTPDAQWYYWSFELESNGYYWVVKQ